ncbi:MAG: iron complex transport system substrate-binding protein, partial [Candidatus Aldehydirespiratoraceae bacterium]
GEGSGVDWLIDAAGGIDIADELGVINNAPINAEELLNQMITDLHGDI